jgi:hypothetical protein
MDSDEAKALVERMGSKRAAAHHLGVPRSTFYHWLDPEPARKRSRRWYANEANRESHQEGQRERYRNMAGTALAKRRLQMRRIKALKRMAQRNRHRKKDEAA